MSLDKTPKSDRFQIIRAVLFMGFFAVLFLIIAVPKDRFTSFVCSYAIGFDGFAQICSDSGQLITSKINSACVDAQGLKISVAFDVPLTGEAHIQVFSAGPDFFPSALGMTDTYEIGMTITTAVDHLDLAIPVQSMPVGEKIFGNIVVSKESVSSQVAYLINVSACSTSGAPAATQTPMSGLNRIPIIQSATCLPSGQLMIAFEFEKPVLGQYQLLVANMPYQLASVVNQPALLFFSGEPPPEGPIVIRLISAIDQEVVFEETYTPPVCDAT